MISIEDFDYNLPDDRIAKYPLAKRDASKLLVYKDNTISSRYFHEIPAHLPDNSLLVFNNTKVIAARLYFIKSTGAKIELFLLDPVAPSTEVAQVMESTNTCKWHCTIGNKKRWKADTPLHMTIKKGDDKISLQATIENRETNLVSFRWNGKYSFADVVEAAGHIPIPPYLHRDDEPIDKDRYQTVYSKPKGAVAAPTAGLHFTDEILTSLKQFNVDTDFVTLHVSAGTFRPIKAENILNHDMHNEQIVINQSLIHKLIQIDKVICVGTTSLRTLESLYWYGVKLLQGENDAFTIEKLYPYQHQHNLPGKKEALQAVLHFMNNKDLPYITGNTQIFIFPGYEFKVCSGLVTNFHLPKSTLLLLIAAFVGKNWRDIYEYALNNDFRFLSYGDASLLLP